MFCHVPGIFNALPLLSFSHDYHIFSLLTSEMEVSLCMFYPFFLQLEAHKNLVDQCVQGEGLVQVNVQIKTDGNIKKINIVDVLKPAEEYVEIADEQCKSLSKYDFGI